MTFGSGVNGCLGHCNYDDVATVMTDINNNCTWPLMADGPFYCGHYREVVS